MIKTSDPIRITVIGDGTTTTNCWILLFFCYIFVNNDIHTYHWPFQMFLSWNRWPPMYSLICWKLPFLPVRHIISRLCCAAQVGKTSLIKVYVSEEFVEEVDDTLHHHARTHIQKKEKVNFVILSHICPLWSIITWNILCFAFSHPQLRCHSSLLLLLLYTFACLSA